MLGNTGGYIFFSELERKILRYREGLKPDSALKKKDELIEQGSDMAWWSHSQLISRYGKDKQQGFYVDNTPFDRR